MFYRGVSNKNGQNLAFYPNFWRRRWDSNPIPLPVLGRKPQYVVFPRYSKVQYVVLRAMSNGKILGYFLGYNLKILGYSPLSS